MTKLLNVLPKDNCKPPTLILWAVALIACLLSPVAANAKYASIVVDANSGRILHATNADTRNYPASLTKMMTLYVLFDDLDSGKITLDKKLVASRRATLQPPSRLGLSYKETITVEQAILALVTKSANDVATVVAENLAGSERAFALRMTSTARKLGMSRTTFRNASGLPHSSQLSTARDMAKLARALLTDHADRYGYFSVKSFTYEGHDYRNHNKLLTSYEGVDGIKTGYIRAAGFNLVASAKRGNERLIGVVFGGKSSTHRNRHMTALLNKGFQFIDQVQQRVASKQPEPENAAPVAQAKASEPAKKGFGWTVQVGAFARYNQAYEAAQTAVDLAPNLLKNGSIKVVPIKRRNGKTLHRARILGITKQQAYKACRSLKSKRMNCMEISDKTSLRLASSE